MTKIIDLVTNEMVDGLDLTQPKNIVGEMIPMSVIEDIRTEIEEIPHYNWFVEKTIRQVSEIIDKHINGKGTDETNCNWFARKNL